MTTPRSAPSGAGLARRVAPWWVCGGYVASILVANYTSTHSPPLRMGVLWVPAGTLWAGMTMTLTLRDLLHEITGARGVLIAVAAGAGLSWLLASPRIAVASVLAFTLSEGLDSVIYSRLRHRSRLAAMLGSNVIGVIGDSVLFVPLAFGSLAPLPGQILGKTVATVAATGSVPAVAVARRWVAR